MKLHRLRAHFHLFALCAALLLAAVSWLGARHYLTLRAQEVEARVAERHARTRVLVAREDLAAGTVLATASLAAREVPVRYVPSSTAHVDDLERVTGQRLLAPLKAGDPVAWTSLAGGGDAAFSTQLAPGRRALTLPVDDVNAIAGLLVPGDVIDLLYTARSGAGSSVRPLLQKILVLATGTATARAAIGGDGTAANEDSTTFATVTLSVTPDEAQRIVLAQRAGELTAVLRHPADDRAVTAQPLDARALVGGEQRDRARARVAQPFVELIVGGGGTGGGMTRMREALAPPPPAAPAPTIAIAAPTTSAAATPRVAADPGNVRERLGLAAARPR